MIAGIRVVAGRAPCASAFPFPLALETTLSLRFDELLAFVTFLLFTGTPLAGLPCTRLFGGARVTRLPAAFERVGYGEVAPVRHRP